MRCFSEQSFLPTLPFSVAFADMAHLFPTRMSCPAFAIFRHTRKEYALPFAGMQMNNLYFYMFNQN
jgi:hypothetical protein